MAEERNIPRILLIDDEPLARFVARKALEKTGAFVTEAETLAHAEELWSGSVFDLVVCDHRLPDGNGVTLIEKLRGQGRHEPVVYLTAEKEEITPEMAARLQLVRVMGKPLDMAIFCEVLKEISTTGTAKDAPLEGEVSDRAIRRVGSFLVRQVEGRCSVEGIEDLKTALEGEAWVALDMSAVTDMDPGAVPALLAWAAASRLSGGRFCLLGPVLDMDGAEALERELDCVAHEEELLPLSRHLSSPSERRAVLESVVMRART
ncbi:MAG: response regulator [Spartobacteria bacterium]|nr:response regulator [Spartobacteria bacterium]